ncbi:MAG: hypothetical protein DRP64_16315 [Verrucomicrobia bacterium]|nr:MAG: hypothetical protein DRP64_16315 [Verrucomicrobiota bacterium]
MSFKGMGKTVIYHLFVSFMVWDASGVDLRKFTEEATGKSSSEPEKKKEQSRVDDIAESSFGSGTYPSDSGSTSFLGGFYAWLVSSPFDYRYDDPSATLNDSEQEGAQRRRHFFPEHLLGEATVPYARVDYNWQSVDGETDANDLRIELGYKLLAFHGRTTMYSTPALGQDMAINQYYGVLRYGGYRPDFLPGTFEAGIGLGVSQIKFEEPGVSIHDSTVAFTLPFKYYPMEWFGVEFRPAWYSWDGIRIGDYDLSASVGYRYMQLRGGYRWLGFRGSSEDLNGPYVGVSVSF